MGFFTDTSVCIGCKACEVACKEWNAVPEDGISLTGMSYDNTRSSARAPGGTSRSSRSRSAIAPTDDRPRSAGHGPTRLDGAGDRRWPGQATESGDGGIRWLMSSDVCKHCTHAACLDVCPTGALFRTEFGTVVVQPTSATAAATACRPAPTA